MPRVSVIIAARNAASYLSETLDSVFAQTFADWEVVLVDDASTDHTAEVAQRYGEGVRVVTREVAGGPSTARNAGIGSAMGELVATLDADDLWTPRYLGEQVALFDRAVAEGRKAGVVCCDARLLEPGGMAADTFADRTARPRAQSVSVEELLRVNLVYTSVLASRAAMLDVGGYAEDLRRAEDYDLWLRIIEAGYEILWNPDLLAVYRVRPESLAAAGAQTSGATAEVYARALQRGNLDGRRRRIARRQRRLYRLLARRAGSGGGRLAALPLTARVALEHPERWGSWIRRGGARSSGSGGLR